MAAYVVFRFTHHMFDYQGGRKKPTEPGNDFGLYTNRPRGMGRMPVEELDPNKEKWGRGLAKFILAYAYLVHGFILMVFLVSLFRVSATYSLDWLGYVVGWIVVAGLIVVPVGRIVSNHLTRDEDDMSYKAVKVFLLGFAVWFLLGLVAAIIDKVIS